MEHIRPEKYTDNDFSHIKEDRRQRASRDPGGATPVPREQRAVGYDGRLITTEPVRRMSEARGAFGIRCQDAIRLSVVG